MSEKGLGVLVGVSEGYMLWGLRAASRVDRRAKVDTVKSMGNLAVLRARKFGAEVKVEPLN